MWVLPPPDSVAQAANKDGEEIDSRVDVFPDGHSPSLLAWGDVCRRHAGAVKKVDPWIFSPTNWPNGTWHQAIQICAVRRRTFCRRKAFDAFQNEVRQKANRLLELLRSDRAVLHHHCADATHVFDTVNEIPKSLPPHPQIGGRHIYINQSRHLERKFKAPNVAVQFAVFCSLNKRATDWILFGDPYAIRTAQRDLKDIAAFQSITGRCVRRDNRQHARTEFAKSVLANRPPTAGPSQTQRKPQKARYPEPLIPPMPANKPRHHCLFPFLEDTKYRLFQPKAPQSSYLPQTSLLIQVARIMLCARSAKSFNLQKIDLRRSGLSKDTPPTAFSTERRDSLTDRCFHRHFGLSHIMLAMNRLQPPRPYTPTSQRAVAGITNPVAGLPATGDRLFVSAEDFDCTGILSGLDLCESLYWWMSELYGPDVQTTLRPALPGPALSEPALPSRKLPAHATRRTPSRSTAAA